MTAKQMWEAFLKVNPSAAGEEVEAWYYGGNGADKLAQLTAYGIKTATSSAYPLYEAEQEPLPRSGSYSVVMKRDGTAVCVVYTTKVYVVPYRKVSSEHAWKEGEGDRSLAYWRMVHEPFFTEALSKADLTFSEDMGVVCEEFVKVYPVLS